MVGVHISGIRYVGRSRYARVLHGLRTKDVGGAFAGNVFGTRRGSLWPRATVFPATLATAARTRRRATPRRRARLVSADTFTALHPCIGAGRCLAWPERDPDPDPDWTATATPSWAVTPNRGIQTFAPVLCPRLRVATPAIRTPTVAEPSVRSTCCCSTC